MHGQFPVGPIANVEHTANHEMFVRAAQPSWISLKLNHARQLDKRGETADSWTPNGTKVLTTSTIHDEELNNLTLEEEAAIIEAFQPDAHVAGDVSVYPYFNEYQRGQLIMEAMKNAIWLKDNTDAPGTSFIPIFKGITRREREISYAGLDKFDHSYAAVYVTRYFSASGYRTEELRDDLAELASETDAKLIIIGLLNSEHVPLPDSVVAASGMNAWLSNVDFETMSSGEMKKVWLSVVEDATEWLPQFDLLHS